jgi:hypothetical protein
MRPALPRRTAGAPLAALALLVAACADSFTPASVVEDLRVLAIVADPPEVWMPDPAGPYQQVTLRPVTAAPPAPDGSVPAPATEAWTFCPFSAGASAGYACAVPCETTLLAAADRSVTVDPISRGIACLVKLGGSLPGAPPGSGAPPQVEMLVRYVATLGGQTREAVQRLPIHFEALPTGVAQNANPLFDAAGGLVAGADCAGAATGCAVGSVRLDVAIDPTSFQSYPGSLDRTLTETVAISFFTTAGRFQYGSGLATSVAPATFTVLDAKDLGGATSALVWAVARDGRGGEAVAGPLPVVFSTP